MDLKDKKVLVIGLARTGMATVLFLVRRGAITMVTDLISPLEQQRRLQDLPIPPAAVQIVPYAASSLQGVDLVVPSPAVPPHDPLLKNALNRGIEIISETELSFRYLRTPLIAITGTNGKTTTTTLVGEILRHCGYRPFVGGNIGRPLIEYVDGNQEADCVVAEVSSFQLQWVELFRPHVAICLNVTTDHLDYHGNFADYLACKLRLFARQTKEDLAIVNAAESWATSVGQIAPVRIAFFGGKQPRLPGISLQEAKLIYQDASGLREAYPQDMVKIPGKHNLENCMAAILAAREFNCPPEEIIKAVSQFRGIPHRIEFAGEKGGVSFYDDSKGTNVGAVARALETFDQPTILLMGGRDKDNDFNELTSSALQRVKLLLTFGEAGDKIAGVLGDRVRTERRARLGDAVCRAYELAVPGDVVLLSPGCASFDEFANYGERGRFFQDVVKNLQEK
jgi:UDP-N-acetylmuramoylalanine--D-glutamate ligase